MKTLRKIALFTLMSFSVLSVSSSFCMRDYSKMTEDGYKALAKWFVDSDWYTKLRLKAAIDKMKEIEWSKVFEYISRK